ncbi:uncharacterized protein [Dasypus novemcinctus]|uniref:uncharacterized protein n=1 Tax=Dasypus novemcinctus TaxID=9361 RepID=UPI00265E5368|nr:uncharacterized protein LOC131273439 [Dasypus novemcinctus]
MPKKEGLSGDRSGAWEEKRTVNVTCRYGLGGIQVPSMFSFPLPQATAAALSTKVLSRLGPALPCTVLTQTPPSLGTALGLLTSAPAAHAASVPSWTARRPLPSTWPGFHTCSFLSPLSYSSLSAFLGQIGTRQDQKQMTGQDCRSLVRASWQASSAVREGSPLAPGPFWLPRPASPLTWPLPLPRHRAHPESGRQAQGATGVPAGRVREREDRGLRGAGLLVADLRGEDTGCSGSEDAIGPRSRAPEPVSRHLCSLHPQDSVPHLHSFLTLEIHRRATWCESLPLASPRHQVRQRSLVKCFWSPGVELLGPSRPSSGGDSSHSFHVFFTIVLFKNGLKEIGFLIYSIHSVNV